MGRNATRASVQHQRAVNQAVIYAARAPARIRVGPALFVRGFRSALRMSQRQLARRCGLPRSHITRLEAGAVDPRLETLRRVFDALFCDILVLPLPRKRPGDALAERRLEGPYRRRVWDD